MERFYQEIATLHFWVSVVGVGVAINLLTALIAKLVPGIGVNLTYWWRLRNQRSSELQSQKEKLFRLKVNVVAREPALISSFLLIGFVLLIFSATLLLLSLWGFFIAIFEDNVRLFGPKFSFAWWWGQFDLYSGVILGATVGVQIFKIANQRVLIAMLAEDRLMKDGLNRINAVASPLPPSEL